ncbi:dienelactone hydrolase [Pseudohalioglobus sediminis]|uniref:Dienelactone hydrolase n=1 Tax=Pseudohalioglobus sediminis TaxID=2606449 RepID=A0A5B0X5D6_9GAMM|nr:dienelactone hydrolase [Pseudohalioglobus sediminis]KAA1193399.1 dienelactone hydrolase [Pseudohalioglobus sediminis]
MANLVRALYRAACVPGAPAPYDRVTLKVHYPAAYQGSEAERNSGLLPAAGDAAPYPVVILLPGINLGAEGSGWLCQQLAEAGFVTVAVTMISEEMPGYISITPGLRMDRLTPEGFGSGPSCQLLAPVLTCLQSLQDDSVLAGLLDLDRLVLAGHSAGGTAALINADPRWLPGLCAVFTYGAHTGAATALGWPEQTLLPMPAALPTLLLGGDRDGVIAASGHRYGGREADPIHSLERTFVDAVREEDGNAYLCILEGANHFSFAHPVDGTTGRDFLDWDTGADPAVTRQRIAELIVAFLGASVHADPGAAAALRTLLQADWLRLVRTK